jgi:hypothetical protein
MATPATTAAAIAELSERLASLHGSVDAYAAGQSARLDGIDKTLTRHEEAIDALRIASTPPRTSGWTVATVVIAGIGGVGAIVMLLVTLIQDLSKIGT